MRSDTSDMDIYAMILVCDTEVCTLSHLYEATEYGEATETEHQPLQHAPPGSHLVAQETSVLSGGKVVKSKSRLGELKSSYFSTKRHYCQYHVIRSCSLIECVA